MAASNCVTVRAGAANDASRRASEHDAHNCTSAYRAGGFRRRPNERRQVESARLSVPAVSVLLLRAAGALLVWLRHPALLGCTLVLVLTVAADGSIGRPALFPAQGALVLVGGGDITPDIAARFVALAGGKNRNFVYIPTAAEDEQIDPPALEQSFRATFGVRHVAILHTRNREVADSRGFTRPLETADAVWFGGGRQWRIADAYIGTRTERALRQLLGRGTSTGASILASYLVRGAPEGNWIVSAPGHERGFGLLPRTAIDQHVDLYHRENDIAPVIMHHPDLLGISLDEATALVVTRDAASVVGRGRVILHDGNSHCGRPYVVLHAGDQIATAGPVAASCHTGTAGWRASTPSKS
jgi:cyanophycinase